MNGNAPRRQPRSESRRRVIATGGAIGVLALGGCLESTGTETEPGDDDNATESDENATEVDENDETDDRSDEEEVEDEPDENETDESASEVRITGSSTVFPLTDAMAERFAREHPAVSVTIDATGTGGGFEHYFCAGESDINGASRPIEAEERSHCTENDVTPVEMTIAADALTVAVNPANDWVDCLSFDELAQIWSEGGADTWSDVRDEWPDEEIVRYAPHGLSGSHDWFAETVIGDPEAHRDDYEATGDEGIIVRGIENEPNAIGYFGYAYYAENEDRVKPVRVSERDGASCAEPTLRGASDGTYPLARPLYLYASEAALQRDAVAKFVRFYVEHSTEPWIADEIGYVPSSDRQAAANRRAIEEAIGE